MGNIRCFYAYQDPPKDHSETIETAIDEINSLGKGLVEVIGWKQLGKIGRPLITTICNAIDSCPLFMCDLTYLNPNVLFEFGYALSKNKKIWISRDPSRNNIDYSKIEYSIGVLKYSDYVNGEELYTHFFDDEPYVNLEETLLENYKDLLSNSINQTPVLLYLKSELSTDASIKLTRAISRYVDNENIHSIHDSPDDVDFRPFDWYLKSVYAADAVIAHLIDNRQNLEKLRKELYSFTAGMAFGLNKPLLLLAHSPFEPPIDYKHLLKVHTTARDCVNNSLDWLKSDNLKTVFSNVRSNKLRQQAQVLTGNSLRQIDLGDPQAENEQYNLGFYFVETEEYRQALRTHGYTLYVGRKGSGKSANMFQIREQLSQDKRNLICLITPDRTDIEGVMRVINSRLFEVDPHFLMEALWKFLVYTELAKFLYESAYSKPMRTPAEEEFLSYVDNDFKLVTSELAVRVESAIKQFEQDEHFDTVEQTRQTIYARFHHYYTNKLRPHLSRLLADKNQIMVLVDNLDDAWRQESDIGKLSSLIFGLLRAGNDIAHSLKLGSGQAKDPRLGLIVFLRSDIFFHIKVAASERDKLKYKMIRWEEGELLKGIIEERILNSTNLISTTEEIWTNLFVPIIDGLPTQEYIVSRIIPRPRDIIVFCTAAITNAINRKHLQVEEKDILDAERQYSRHAYDSLVAELITQIPETERLLVALSGCNEVIARDDFESYLVGAGIATTHFDRVVDLLCDTAFLGLKNYRGEFEFIYDYDQHKREVLRSSNRKSELMDSREQFMIHRAYHLDLNISKVSPQS